MRLNIEKKKVNKEDICLDKELLKSIEYRDVLFVISKEIVDYRERNNLTQQQLATKLNITQEMVSKIESGRYNISVEKLVSLWCDLSDDNFSMGEQILSSLLKKIKINYVQTNVAFIDEKINRTYKFTKNYSKTFEADKLNSNYMNTEYRISKVG